MCMPGLLGGAPKADNSAEIARQEEAARQARIQAGQTAIDEQFAGFNDDYYKKYETDYLGYYTPQLDEQYADARKKATLKLAGSGGLQTSAGASQLADLFKGYSDQKATLAGSAIDAVNDMRGKIDQNKTDLYGLNRNAADPAQATAMATQRASGIQPPAFVPLGNVFSDLLQNVGTGIALESRGYPGLGTGLFSTSGGSKGSSKVVK